MTLKRKGYYIDLHTIIYLFVDTRIGYIDPSLLRCAVKSLHVPIADDVLAAIVHKMGKDAKGFVQYDELLERINWRKNPQPPLQFEMNRVRSVEKIRGIYEIMF